MSFERKKQLNMLDRNLDFTKSLSSKNQEGPNVNSSVNIQQGYDGQLGPQGQSQQEYPGYEPSTGLEGGLPNRGGQMSQSVENMGTRRRQQPPQARNDYDYIKLKNSSWGNKFDIISNKIKDFAK